MGKWQQGQSGNPTGRPRGVPNKLTMELREALMAPFDPEKFRQWAEKREDLYYTQILTKLLPKDLHIKREFNSVEELIASLPESSIFALAESIEAQREKKEAKPD